MAERRRGREASGSAGRREAGGSPGGGSAAAASGSPARTPGVNAFANDGSFMELFKKMEEEKQRREASGTDAENGGKRGPEAGSDGHSSRKPTLNIVGKRRGGAKLALKTGMVAKKHKADEEAEARGGDAWAKYMAEVKKYKAHQCSDDDKTRPLVK
ncbi:telomerase RNA component interacting RNase isoform X1 [Mobula hypostoma]|uniref:telomerase RNA component interacting RNase isoform X1 n=1 Tax=Mobula hypostoma TaxID=723540 RepID=UPI002FC2C4D4